MEHYESEKSWLVSKEALMAYGKDNNLVTLLDRLLRAERLTVDIGDWLHLARAWKDLGDVGMARDLLRYSEVKASEEGLLHWCAREWVEMFSDFRAARRVLEIAVSQCGASSSISSIVREWESLFPGDEEWRELYDIGKVDLSVQPPDSLVSFLDAWTKVGGSEGVFMLVTRHLEEHELDDWLLARFIRIRMARYPNSHRCSILLKQQIEGAKKPCDKEILISLLLDLAPVETRVVAGWCRTLENEAETTADWLFTSKSWVDYLGDQDAFERCLAMAKKRIIPKDSGNSSSVKRNGRAEFISYNELEPDHNRLTGWKLSFVPCFGKAIA